MGAQDSTYTVRVEIHRERIGESGVDILMVHNKKDDKKPAGWGFPGGGVDPEDKSLKIAAVREVYEETGLVISPEDLFEKTRSFAGSSETHVNVSYGVVIYESAMGEITVDHDPKKAVDDVQWIPCEDAMDAYVSMKGGLTPQDSKGRRYYKNHLLVACEVS